MADCSIKLVLQPKNFCRPIDFLNFFPVKLLVLRSLAHYIPEQYDSIRSVRYFGALSCIILQTRQFFNHESRLLSRSHTFAIIVILDLKIHESMWIHWSFFPKTWTKGHWPLDDLWPHVCWGHMCDSMQGSLCPSPMTIHQCMWIQWSILQNTTYILHIMDILRTEWVIT